jgi:hypothetical protein
MCEESVPLRHPMFRLCFVKILDDPVLRAIHVSVCNEWTTDAVKLSFVAEFLRNEHSVTDACSCTVLVGRTLEQQGGREDDEGKGWRLAVDAKSDLC